MRSEKLVNAIFERCHALTLPPTCSEDEVIDHLLTENQCKLLFIEIGTLSLHSWEESYCGM